MARHAARSPRGPAPHRANAHAALATEQKPAAGLDGTAPFPRLGRLNLPQNPDETLHIRRLENGLERPSGRLGPAPERLASLVGTDAFAGALTRGSIGTIPATVETEYKGVISESYLADEPVLGEPVSEARFPAIREKNREFRENRAVWQKAARQNVAKSVC